MSTNQLPDTPDVPGTTTVVGNGPQSVALLGFPTEVSRCEAPEPRPGGTERYELLEEIARGGMGIVFRARDRLLDREVGLKTLLRVPPEGSAIASRFRTEAHITGQLQHPNIPPIHDLGTLPDGRPYLAMKLIKGRTLDAMLRARSAPAHEPGRYLAIFEDIAQGVAYAHDHSVLHRDLKPLNVMVGSFGEVQVMDWGLAKHLADATTATGSDADTGPPTEIRPSCDEGKETRPGSIFGTPAYMPREQAIGAVDQIDTRSDVFSLGGLLCTILTGAPPFVGGDAESTRQLAAVAKLDGAFARLDACGAEPGLIALCKRCLSAERDDRPRDAGEVARAVAALRTEAEDRARRAELDRVRADGERAKAELRAAEQRKRRKVQLVLLATAAVLFGGTGAFVWREDKQATDRMFRDQEAVTIRKEERERDAADRKAAEARLEGQRDAEARNRVNEARAAVSAGLAFASELRGRYNFKEAEAALEQAADRAAAGAPERLEEVKRAQRDLDFVVKLDDIRFRKWMYIVEPGVKGEFNWKIASPEYRKAFADRGLDLTALDVNEVVTRIAASRVKPDLVAAVDDWALYEPNDALRDRLLDIARKVDPGAWTDRLRDPTKWKKELQLSQLAATADLVGTPSAALSVLATLMGRNNLNPSSLLASAWAKYPKDFELAVALGTWYGGIGKDAQAIGPYSAACALRPENPAIWFNLGAARAATGDYDGAIAAYKKTIELESKLALAHNNLGLARHHTGDYDGAIAAYNRTIELDPGFARAHSNLGVALAEKGDYDGAIAAHKRAIELAPELALAHSNLAIVLARKGDTDGAVAAYNRAIGLGLKNARVYYNLGYALQRKSDLDGAVAYYNKAIELEPKYAKAHSGLGDALHRKGDVDGAIAHYNRAIELEPKDAKAYCGLGAVLPRKGDVDGAVAACKKAIELEPGLALAHNNLAGNYLAQKKHSEAIAAARAAIKADPNLPSAHALLGIALQQIGNISGAREALTEAARLDKRLAPLLAKLPPVSLAPPPREVTRP